MTRRDERERERAMNGKGRQGKNRESERVENGEKEGRRECVC
jgi:hypothetical protein